MANTHSTDIEGSSAQSWSITDASQSGLDFSSGMSISMQVKFESIPGSGGVYLVSKFSGQFAYRLLYNSTQGLYFSTSSNGSNNTGGYRAVTLNTGTWYHIGVSKVGTTATIYVNGVSIGSVTVTSSIHNSSSAFHIGAQLDAPFDGLINDVIVYNDGIGANLATNYNTPCSPYLTNAVSRWFSDGDNANDAIGSNHLTGSNGPTYSTDVAYSCSAPTFNPAIARRRLLHA